MSQYCASLFIALSASVSTDCLWLCNESTQTETLLMIQSMDPPFQFLKQRKSHGMGFCTSFLPPPPAGMCFVKVLPM